MENFEQAMALMKSGKHVALDGTLDAWMAQVGPYIADFTQKCEKQRVMWRVPIISPRFEWSVQAIKSLRAYPLAVDIMQGYALHGASGFICALWDKERDMRAMYAQRVLWVVHSDNPNVWAYLSTHVEEGAQIIGFSPYPAYRYLFDNLKEHVNESR